MSAQSSTQFPVEQTRAERDGNEINITQGNGLQAGLLALLAAAHAER